MVEFAVGLGKQGLDSGGWTSFPEQGLGGGDLRRPHRPEIFPIDGRRKPLHQPQIGLETRREGLFQVDGAHDFSVVAEHRQALQGIPPHDGNALKQIIILTGDVHGAGHDARHRHARGGPQGELSDDVIHGDHAHDAPLGTQHDNTLLAMDPQEPQGLATVPVPAHRRQRLGHDVSHPSPEQALLVWSEFWHVLSSAAQRRTDPITGNDVRNLDHAPCIIDAGLKIYFESERSRQAFTDIEVEHPGSDLEHNLDNPAAMGPGGRRA